MEHRRALDMEGFTNDVSLLRKQLASVDRKLHQMRLLDRLEDDDRLHSVLQQLQKRSPVAGGKATSRHVRPHRSTPALVPARLHCGLVDCTVGL